MNTYVIAAKLRRKIIDAAESKLNARTKRDEAQHLGELFAYARSLGIVLAESTVDWTDPAARDIAPGAGSYSDGRGHAEALRFLGPHESKDLGFTEEVTA
jgi:hypothetical protein